MRLHGTEIPDFRPKFTAEQIEQGRLTIGELVLPCDTLPVECRVRTADERLAYENRVIAHDATSLLLGRLAKMDRRGRDYVPPVSVVYREATPAPAELVALDLDVSSQDRRRYAYRLQASAARLVPSERVACCHRLVQDASQVEVRRAEGRSYLSGTQTCGSVWHCPICAPKITEARRGDLQHLSEFVRGNGGQLLMLTLTVPHQRHDDLPKMLDQLAAAWRYFVSGKHALSRQLARWGYLGYVRALEVTHGEAHGWHPHLHVLVAVGSPISEDDQVALSGALWVRWDKATRRHGFGQIDPVHGLRLDVPKVAGLDRDLVTDYVTKWGAAEELSKLHSKMPRKEGAGRTPWALLADYEQGDKRAGALWAEYAAAFKGRRQLFWSRGLRDLCGLAPDQSDEDIAAAEPAEHEVVHTLERREWVAVRAVGCRGELLDRADYGPEHVRAYLGECVQRYEAQYGPLGRVRAGDLIEEAASLTDGG